MRKFTFLLIIVSLINFRFSFGQLLSGNVFLQGNYVETGIARNGALGSGILPPSSYHPTSSGTLFNSLGIVCDKDKDGWATGIPQYYGEFISHGSPVERWAVQVNGIMAVANRAVSDSSMTAGLKGKNTNYLSLAGQRIGVWEGEFGDLAITQIATVDINNLYVRFEVYLQNKGSTTLRDIYYHRSVDPDHEEESSGTDKFTSHLKIEQQIPNDQQWVAVSATGNTYKSYLSLVAKDCRAKAYFINSGLLSNARLDSLYKGIGLSSSHYYAKGDSVFIDAGMGIVFQLDSLQAGAQKMIQFAYILNKADAAYLADSVFSPHWLTSGGMIKKNKDTLYVCEDEITGIDIIASGSDNWVWDPSPYLGSTTGSSSLVFPKGLNSFRAIRNNLMSCGSIDTLYMIVNAFPKPKPVLSRIGFILSTAKKYLAYQWYKDGVAITGSKKDSIHLIFKGYYKVEVIDSNGCRGFSDSVEVSGGTISIAETDLNSDILIKVSPNPTSGRFWVDAEEGLQSRVVDISGRVIKDYSADKLIDLSDYPDGLYFLQCRKEQNSLISVQKIVKQSTK